MQKVMVYKDPRVRGNMERFATPTIHDVHIDSAMSNVSIAYRNAMYVAETIFPAVPVVHQSNKYFIFN